MTPSLIDIMRAASLWSTLAAMRIGLAIWARRNPGVLPPMGPSAFGDSVAAAIAGAFLVVALALREVVALVADFVP